MPFTTDSTWPTGLRTIFDICRQKPPLLEHRYYGPYIKLLTYCFGPDSFDFFVAPLPPDSYEPPPPDAINLIPFLVVFDARRRPVLIADIKDDAWMNKAESRFRADLHIRHRFNSLSADCPLPRLWGLSLLGTSLRVYTSDVADRLIEPLFMDRPTPNRTLPRDFLEGAWNVDILSREGFAKMKEIVEDIVHNEAGL